MTQVLVIDWLKALLLLLANILVFYLLWVLRLQIQYWQYLGLIVDDFCRWLLVLIQCNAFVNGSRQLILVQRMSYSFLVRAEDNLSNALPS